MITTFKYRSPASALRSLVEETAYFASPSELNDALEVKFDTASPEEVLKTFHNTLLELGLKQGRVSDVPYAKTKFPKFEGAAKSENERFQEYCKRVGIYSTSKRPDSLPMWAYYCGAQGGVCFELEWSNAIFERHQLWPAEVIYTGESRIHNRAEDYRYLILELQSENPDWSVEQLTAYTLTEEFRRRWGLITTGRAVSTKHADWSHEKEVRIIAPRPGAIQLLRDTLKRVYFFKPGFPEYISIIRVLHQQYPDVKLAEIRFSHKEPFAFMHEMTLKKVPVEQL